MTVQASPITEWETNSQTLMECDLVQVSKGDSLTRETTHGRSESSKWTTVKKNIRLYHFCLI